MSSPVSAIPFFDDDDQSYGMAKHQIVHQPNHELIHYQAPATSLPLLHVPAAESTSATSTPATGLPKVDHTTTNQEECSICLEELITGPSVTIKSCGHAFHQSCISECLIKTMKCPNCRAPAGNPQGPAPSGTMTLKYMPYICSGFGPNTTTIEIHYHIPRGIQRSYHDNPGQVYHSTSRVAYLPDNTEGRTLANRLKYAFDHGLTFRIGTSLTSGRPNSVTWASIHHKTSTHGGQHGFPDNKYIANCNESLDALHVPKVVDTSYAGLHSIHYTAPNHLLGAQVSLAAVLERWRPPTTARLVKQAATSADDVGVVVVAPQGTSPSGTMIIDRTPEICPGFGIVGSFRITYKLPSNVQMPYHPNPNVLHAGTTRFTYLPDTLEGIQLLQRLKYAFVHGLTFDVGRSLTNGLDNQIVWSTIPHKTSLRDPSSPYSFPDPNYMAECHAKLDQAGVPRHV